jgi:hypothetical protein
LQKIASTKELNYTIAVLKKYKNIIIKRTTMIKLFSTQYGSRLYGTQTPSSDIDLKHVVLPDLGDLLLGKKVQNKVKKTNNLKNTRNGPDDIDEEFIPLQVFARDFVEGQTYALEIAFSVEGKHAGQKIHDMGELSSSRFLLFVRDLRAKFLTSNIKAMMGYAVNQASLYSFKGERLNVTRELLSIIVNASLYYQEYEMTLGSLASIPEFAKLFNDLALQYPKYFRQDQYDIGGGRYKPCMIILEKTLPFTNTIVHTLTVLNALNKKYGARAEQASDSNVDWKATMHALRIVDEGLDLLKNRKITLPFKQDYIDYLLAIKRGEVPIEIVKQELDEKLDLLKELEKTTDLPVCNQQLLEEF